MYAPRGLYCKRHRDLEKWPRNESAYIPYLDEKRAEQITLNPNFYRSNVAKDCTAKGCALGAHHRPPHQSWTNCATYGCYKYNGHTGEHTDSLLSRMSTEVAQRYEESVKEVRMQLQNLNHVVLGDMRRRIQPEEAAIESKHQVPELSPSSQAVVTRPKITRSRSLQHSKTKSRSGWQRVRGLEVPQPNPDLEEQESPYQPLEHAKREIRLYELLPNPGSTQIKGRFVINSIAHCPPYTALSYMWGAEEDSKHDILVGDSKHITVRKNLWEFLKLQSSILEAPRLFWIDAVCINQPDILERNHQVAVMKEIYTNATDVYIWLGTEADNSDLGMDWLIQRDTRKLRPHGPGYHPVWNRMQGQVLVKLCERPYWRRMWIIQEILHAKRITLWCGPRSVDWAVIEQLYLTLSTLQDKCWDTHHESVLGVMQSSAAVMTWQRAHWRHPELAAPRLQTLIDIFQDWQCKDRRDKVFALVSMASRETAIEPDYSLTTREVYHAVQKHHPDAGWKFENLLSQILGLSGQDVQLLHGQHLIEYKVRPSEAMVLRRRVLDDDW